MVTHIQIGDVAPRAQYTTDGTQTQFTYPFPIFKDADMGVYLNDTKQTTGYAVTGAGDSAGGKVTFAVAPSNGVVVTLSREIAIQRTSDFQESGELRSKVLNDELDYIVALLQQVEDGAYVRGLHIAAHDDTDGEMHLPVKDERLGKLLAFDPVTGLPVVSTESLAEIEGAATSAAAATVSETNAAASAASADADAAAAQAAVGGVRVSAGDTAADNLEAKLLPGNGLTVSTQNHGANETYTFAVNGAVVALLGQANAFTQRISFPVGTTGPQVNIIAGDVATAGTAAINLQTGNGTGGARLWGIEVDDVDYGIRFIDRVSASPIAKLGFNGGMAVGEATGGARGPGTVNAVNYFEDGAPVFPARAWVRYSSVTTTAIIGSKGVLALTDNGVGLTTPTLSTAMPNTTWSALVVAGNTAGDVAYAAARNQTTSSVQIFTHNVSNLLADFDEVDVVIFGG